MPAAKEELSVAVHFKTFVPSPAKLKPLDAAVNGVPLNVQLLKLLIPVPETPVTVTPDGNTSLMVTLVPEAIFPVLPM